MSYRPLENTINMEKTYLTPKNNHVAINGTYVFTKKILAHSYEKIRWQWVRKTVQKDVDVHTEH